MVVGVVVCGGGGGVIVVVGGVVVVGGGGGGAAVVVVAATTAAVVTVDVAGVRWTGLRAGMRGFRGKTLGTTVGHQSSNHPPYI